MSLKNQDFSLRLLPDHSPQSCLGKRLTLCLGRMHFVTVLKRGKAKHAAVHHKLVLLHHTEHASMLLINGQCAVTRTDGNKVKIALWARFYNRNRCNILLYCLFGL